MTLDYRPGLGGLNQVYGPNRYTRSVKGICGKYINIFTRCTIRNQHDIIKTAIADVSKGQTDISYKGDLQTHTKLIMDIDLCLLIANLFIYKARLFGQNNIDIIRYLIELKYKFK